MSLSICSASLRQGIVSHGMSSGKTLHRSRSSIAICISFCRVYTACFCSVAFWLCMVGERGEAVSAPRTVRDLERRRGTLSSSVLPSLLLLDSFMSFSSLLISALAATCFSCTAFTVASISAIDRLSLATCAPIYYPGEGNRKKSEGENETRENETCTRVGLLLLTSSFNNSCSLISSSPVRARHAGRCQAHYLGHRFTLARHLPLLLFTYSSLTILTHHQIYYHGL